MAPDPFLQQSQESVHATQSTLAAGQRVFGGRYLLERHLGQGGMGQVWLAQDTTLDEPRALKFVLPALLSDATAHKRLRNEARLGTHLAHPRIVRVFDFAEESDGSALAAVVMEYVEGRTLNELLAAQEIGFFEPEEIETWVQDVIEGLRYAHEEKQRYHLDLKPGNIIIETATGRAKLLDFGISRSAKDTITRLTGQVSSGTLPYMSPQQLDGEPPCAADDVYGLGATVYELLTGTPPFFRGKLEDQIRSKAPDPLAERRRLNAREGLNGELGHPLPEFWCQGVLAMLSKRPEERWWINDVPPLVRDEVKTKPIKEKPKPVTAKLPAPKETLASEVVRGAQPNVVVKAATFVLALLTLTLALCSVSLHKAGLSGATEEPPIELVLDVKVAPFALGALVIALGVPLASVIFGRLGWKTIPKSWWVMAALATLMLWNVIDHASALLITYEGYDRAWRTALLCEYLLALIALLWGCWQVSSEWPWGQSKRTQSKQVAILVLIGLAILLSGGLTLCVLLPWSWLPPSTWALQWKQLGPNHYAVDWGITARVAISVVMLLLPMGMQIMLPASLRRWWDYMLMLGLMTALGFARIIIHSFWKFTAFHIESAESFHLSQPWTVEHLLQDSGRIMTSTSVAVVLSILALIYLLWCRRRALKTESLAASTSDC